ncbi:hypothetical protein LXA43DRAFT_426540 [Ganoderma leucocontextum]|nr:hypothetical protein LXA43DRAFT_426540 [Ganoderma leucocontextum]
MSDTTSVHLVVSSAESCSPWIPPELISRILTMLWEAPQTPEERSALLKNITLVNRTWLTLVALIVSRDVHISDKENAYTFLRLLSKSSPRPKADDLFTTEKTRFANEACCSLTFHVDGKFSRSPSPITQDTFDTKLTPGSWPSPAHDASNAMSLILDMLSALDYLPNLQHLSFRYTNWGYGDAFDHLELETFPPQVTRLSIDYSFTLRSEFLCSMLLLWMKTRDRDRAYAPRGPRAPVRIPNLRHLSLSGVWTAFAIAILQLCPNIETLEIRLTGDTAVQLDELAPLSPTLRTLVLRHPGVALSRRRMMWLQSNLLTALEEGLFPEGSTKPRIVVRWGTSDPDVFTALMRACTRFNTELVYDSRQPL